MKAGGSDKPRPSKMYQMKRKGLGQAMRNWCVVEELRERHLLDSVDEGELFGPKSDQGQAVSLKESLDLFMERVDEWRSQELYPHKCTSLDCEKRGCQKVTVVDGLWKLSYPICMFDNARAVPQDIQDYIPHDCVNSPAPGKAFCNAHCEQLKALKIPTGLREFITFCGASASTFDLCQCDDSENADTLGAAGMSDSRQ